MKRIYRVEVIIYEIEQEDNLDEQFEMTNYEEIVGEFDTAEEAIEFANTLTVVK